MLQTSHQIVGVLELATVLKHRKTHSPGAGQNPHDLWKNHISVTFMQNMETQGYIRNVIQNTLNPRFYYIYFDIRTSSFIFTILNLFQGRF